MVNLIAHFDEKANITCAERLERLGAQVVYGTVSLTTLAKMALVLRGKSGPLD